MEFRLSEGVPTSRRTPLRCFFRLCPGVGDHPMTDGYVVEKHGDRCCPLWTPLTDLELMFTETVTGCVPSCNQKFEFENSSGS